MSSPAPSIRTPLIISLLLHSTGCVGIAALSSMAPIESADRSVMVAELISSQRDVPADHSLGTHTERLSPSQKNKDIFSAVGQDPGALLPAETVTKRRTPLATVGINNGQPTQAPSLYEQKVGSDSGPLQSATEESSQVLKADKGSEEGAAVSETPVGAAPAERRTDLKGYLREVRGQLERAKRYPWLARLRGWEGTTRLQFVITPSGEAEGVFLVQSSGWKSLDQEALDLVKRVGRFPSPPKMQKEGIKIQVPLVFQLERP